MFEITGWVKHELTPGLFDERVITSGDKEMSSKSPDYREPWSQKHILAQVWQICRIPKPLLHSPLDASHPHNVTFPRKGESLHPVTGKKPREARSGDLSLVRSEKLFAGSDPTPTRDSERFLWMSGLASWFEARRPHVAESSIRTCADARRRMTEAVVRMSNPYPGGNRDR